MKEDQQQLLAIMAEMAGNFSRLEAKLKSKHPRLYHNVVASWSFSFPPKNFIEVCYLFITPDSTPICEHNQRKKFEYFSTGYVGCSRNCQCVRDKKAQTMTAKYGVSHPLQSPELLIKAKATWQEKYGTTLLHEINTEQKKNTNMERYGSATPLESEAVRNKISDTNIANLGVDKPFKSTVIQQKAAATIQNKYGVRSVLALPENADAAKQAMIDKYGTESSFSLGSVRQKINDTMLDRYGVLHISQRHIEPALLASFKDDDLFSEIYLSCKRVSDVMAHYGIGRSSVHQRAAELSLPVKCSKVSEDEQNLADFISEYVEVEQSNRTVIAPKEIDIWIPSHRIGIEFNGIYYHSTKFRKERDSHLAKTVSAEEADIQLIHIFSDEWKHKPDIVKSRILHLLGKTAQKVSARTCSVVNIDACRSNSFLNENHIQGSCVSRHSYALEHAGNIVAVMTFGPPRFNKTAVWELLRFCSVINTNVVGAAGKLLAHFRKTHSGSIMTYADRRWSSGNLYKSIGFKHINDTAPNYFYVVDGRRESRNKYQKHKLHKLLTCYNELLSEEHNMRMNGFYRVYDCGNSAWFLE